MNIKRIVSTVIVASALLAIAIPAMAQGPASPEGTLGRWAPPLAGPPAGSPWGNLAPGSGDITELTEAEIAGLEFMREEEKLARDVYTALYERWELDAFQRIAGSEQRHLETALRWLEHYGIADPAEGLEAGEFANAELQRMYDDLVARGGTSLEEALRVGAAIEELDILDLEDYLAGTENIALQRLYSNLLSGSHNHLRAFASLLESEVAVTYEPQHLDAESYGVIIASEGERGPGRGIGRQMSGVGTGECTESCENGAPRDGTGVGRGGRMGRGGGLR